MTFNDDLEYWGIDKLLMDSCCGLKHFPEMEISQQEKLQEQVRKAKEWARRLNENFGSSTIGKCRTFLWNLTEYPESGRAAKVEESKK